MLLDGLFSQGVDLLTINLSESADYYVPLRTPNPITKEDTLDFNVTPTQIDIAIDKNESEKLATSTGNQISEVMVFMTKTKLEINNFVFYNNSFWRIDMERNIPGQKPSKGYWYDSFREAANRVN